MRARLAPRKRRDFPLGWARWAFGLCLLLIASSAAAAPQSPPQGQPAKRQERPALPQKLLGGYVLEAQGNVRWVYPESAQSEVVSLQAQMPGYLKQLEDAFGVAVSDELDIRVGLNVDDMGKLAEGHGIPDYAQGVAYPQEGLILLTFSAPFSFTRPAMEQVLLHELSHVALHRAVNGQPIPRWFTEGVAITQADEHSLQRMRVLWESAMSKRLLPMSELSRDFPHNHHDVTVAYAQSADLLRHMTDGADEQTRFRSLLEHLRSGEPFTVAVRQAYGVSLGYMEREWRSSLVRNYGRFPSLLTGLTLLWAVTAVLLFVGYLRARKKHRETLEQWQIEEAAEASAAERVHTPVLLRVSSSDRMPGRNRHRVDEFMDKFQGQVTPESEVPTVEHDGRSHTLH